MTLLTTDSTDRNWEQTKNGTQVLRAVSQFADSTGDGGVRLDRNALLMWSICINADSVSRILPKVDPRNEKITKPVDHSLFLKSTVIDLPLDAIRWIESVTGLSQDRIGDLIGVTRQAINVWKRGGRITDDRRRRIFAVREVIERAATRYTTREQLVAWLDTPRGADGRTPAELLKANEINRARLFAVSVPSPRLVRAPSWVNRSIPEAFRPGAERRQEVLPPHVEDNLPEEDDTDED
jgi:uncharacterized protein (DUF2384 family)